MSIPRRDILKGLGATAAASAVGCGPGAAAEPGAIAHVVLVMMENRTFDHYLGSLSLEEGRDVDGLADGMSNPDPRGGPDLEPFPATEPCLSDPPHSWDSSHRQVNDGAMDGFTAEYARRGADPAGVMGYLRREDLPITYALADAYAVCDRWFASLLCGTWPNRLYAVAGQSGGVKVNEFPGPEYHFDFPTIFHRLDDAGIPWGAYSTNASTLWLFDDLRSREELRSIDHFLAHARDGRLPAVSWVEPGFGLNDDHPPVHPMLGQLFLATIHEALAQSPAWDKTLLVIYYDEHGGFFDHVPPPTAADDRADEGFDQLGVRIPAIVCGPFVRPGTDRTVRDHTSVLAHLERMFGLEPLTTRTEAVNDLSSLLDEDRMAEGRPRAPARLPTLTMTEDEIRAQCERARRSALDQPLLEQALDRHPAPGHLDRRHEPEQVLLEALAHARALGALV